MENVKHECTDELQHHGTKGMKWGVRLYQSKDGSLTPLGRVRYATDKNFRVKAKRAASLKKARDARAAKKKAEEEAKIAAEKRAKDVADGKIPVKKMTDDELRGRLNRLNAEKQYKEYELATNTRKRVASKLFNDAVVPGAVEAGKMLTNKLLSKYGMKALGLDKKDEKSAHDKLKEQWEESKWTKEILSNNKQSKHLREEAKAAKEAKEAAKKATDKKATETKTETEKETWTGTVEGVGTSKGSQSQSANKSKPSNYYDPIDSDGRWVNDTPVSNLPAVYKPSDSSRVNRYLEDYGGLLLEDFNNR